MSAASPTANELVSGVYATIGAKLYLNERNADFHFMFESSDGQYERVPAHKLLLTTVSDVFETMFNGSWLEMHEVEIVDAPIASFKEFLQFFYLGRVKLTMDNVAKVMYLANKYNVTECLALCTKFLRRTITNDNVCLAYGLAILHEQSDLKRLCELMIAIHTKAVFSSENFLECDKKTLGHILKLDSFSCSEADVFEACMAWVRNASEEENLTKEIVKTHLGELFYAIYYPSISIEVFANLDPSYGGLFTLDEYREIVQLIGNKNFQAKLFNGTRRQRFKGIVCDKALEIDCTRAIANKYSFVPYYIKNIETTRFSTNEPLALTSFYCTKTMIYQNGTYENLKEKLPSEVSVVYVSATGKEFVLHNSTTNLKLDDISRISLAKPILIKPGLMYEIRFKQTPPNNCCTGIQMKTEIQLEPDVTVQFHNDPIPENDGIARGLLRGLVLNRI
ncbi:BTB/POZ domain-containing protein 2-like isoform X1 [Sitodiplosis mosellana]|uniref:BTB/POZ domain-containing protein 2-like isoform X1 n=1 Tax=Sitodiplosis mosellana TaxID=263140 RepID=UPI00244463D8|nr:BTB/POZ domain-containing protein 2-like isoform X1 [Sitodiplosis mosellana]